VGVVATLVNVDQVIKSSGYWAVFLLVGMESLGIPLPGETALIIAGAYAGTTHHLNPWVIFLVASAGAIVGDNIGYWIGDKGGYRLVRRYGPKVHFDERKLKVGRYLFDHYGTRVVFFGRFVSVLRAYAAFLAGTMRMRWRDFLAANAAGGILWAAIYTFGSYFAGQTLHRISGTLNIVLAALAVVVLASALVVVRRHTKRLEALAEAAYPDPLE
jgi:membrane protein DedA with SNARE-associated domain